MCLKIESRAAFKSKLQIMLAEYFPRFNLYHKFIPATCNIGAFTRYILVGYAWPHTAWISEIYKYHGTSSMSGVFVYSICKNSLG